MPERILIAIDPALDVDAEALVAGWNEGAAGRDIGSLRAGAAGEGAATFVATEAAVLVLNALVGVAGGVASAALYDYLKARFGPEKEAVVVEIEQPDGTPVLVVRVKGG